MCIHCLGTLICYRENTRNRSPIQSMLKYLNTVAHTSDVEMGDPRPARGAYAGGL
jgi:hypothetical protein